MHVAERYFGTCMGIPPKTWGRGDRHSADQYRSTLRHLGNSYDVIRMRFDPPRPSRHVTLSLEELPGRALAPWSLPPLRRQMNPGRLPGFIQRLNGGRDQGARAPQSHGDRGSGTGMRRAGPVLAAVVISVSAPRSPCPPCSEQGGPVFWFRSFNGPLRTLL